MSQPSLTVIILSSAPQLPTRLRPFRTHGRTGGLAVEAVEGGGGRLLGPPRGHHAQPHGDGGTIALAPPPAQPQDRE